MVFRLLLLILLVARLLSAGEESGISGGLIGLAADDAAVRQQTLERLGGSGDQRLLPFLEAYQQGSAYVWQGRAVLVETLHDGHGVPLDPFSRVALSAAVPAAELTEMPMGRRERLWARDAITLLRLTDPDRGVRLAAVTRAGDGGGAANAAALEKLLVGETDAKIRRLADEGLCLIRLEDPALRGVAAERLGELGAARALPRLKELQRQHAGDALIASTITVTINRIERWQTGIGAAQMLFSGLSAGSVLILMALGLSIIFGLMGVINMAHGELLMVGAYAAFVVQEIFFRWLPPAALDWYFPCAIPAAFFVAAAVGWLLELTVIRHLYGRPLETLLATWGVSFLLIQTARVIFGDNRAVNAPTWLQGGVEVVTDLVLPYNRLFILGFTIVCVVGMALLIARTRLGLLLRATTQNRTMASSLGVATRRIDGLTFALGAGIAGMAGATLTLIGGITPDMGQGYIIDSFLVVATGGVGKLAGAVWAGLSLGVLNKLLEPAVQAVWAKVLVLAAVIVFLQWRPSGLFPAKGRHADV